MDQTYFISRTELLGVGFSIKGARQFEDFQVRHANLDDTVASRLEATQTLREATFLTLSSNAELPNERVLTLGEGLSFEITDTTAKLATTGLVRALGGHEISFVGAGRSEVVVPLSGTLATREGGEVLVNKTLSEPKVINLVSAADDTAAAAAGVEIGGVYRNGSALQIRVA